jgi:hypothetical protein
MKNYDNVKWIGAEDFNMLENILLRCFGWYFFIQAVLVSGILSLQFRPR